MLGLSIVPPPPGYLPKPFINLKAISRFIEISSIVEERISNILGGLFPHCSIHFWRLCHQKNLPNFNFPCLPCKKINNKQSIVHDNMAIFDFDDAFWRNWETYDILWPSDAIWSILTQHLVLLKKINKQSNFHTSIISPHKKFRGCVSMDFMGSAEPIEFQRRVQGLMEKQIQLIRRLTNKFL